MLPFCHARRQRSLTGPLVRLARSSAVGLGNVSLDSPLGGLVPDARDSVLTECSKASPKTDSCFDVFEPGFGSTLTPSASSSIQSVSRRSRGFVLLKVRGTFAECEDTARKPPTSILRKNIKRRRYCETSQHTFLFHTILQQRISDTMVSQSTPKY